MTWNYIQENGNAQEQLQELRGIFKKNILNTCYVNNLRGQAYHHLTLLVGADLQVLSKSLKSPWRDKIESNATRSVRAPAVGFLKQDDANANVEQSKLAIVEAYR